MRTHCKENVKKLLNILDISRFSCVWHNNLAIKQLNGLLGKTGQAKMLTTPASLHKEQAIDYCTSLGTIFVIDIYLMNCALFSKCKTIVAFHLSRTISLYCFEDIFTLQHFLACA